jgi:diguanylate cyclase (GGDEF)-like protein
MMGALSIGFVLTGEALLAIAYMHVLQVRKSERYVGRGWMFAATLILFFIISYAVYLMLLIDISVGAVEMATSVILMAGGLFVLVVSRMSLHTISSIRRIASLERHRAEHDHLTDLPNRILLKERLDEALEKARKNKQTLAILMSDLDRFKEINDTLGHHYGDQLLQHIAPRLRSAVRQSDTVARLGGDEFAILLPEVGLDGAVRVSEKIVELLQPSVMIDGHMLNVGISIGIAIYPDHGVTGDTLLQKADVAMYNAKRAEKEYAVYDPEQDNYSVNRLLITGELRNALASEELVLHYQPKIDIDSGEVCGVEALVRWEHPRFGLIYPDDFIDLAEQSGLIRPLALWVLNTAMRQLGDWRHQGYPLSMSVNLSTKNLLDPEFPEQLRGRLQAWDIDPDRLILEITESAMMVDPGRALDTVGQIDAMGVGLSIDDFGTGYSSLAYLKQLPSGEIKIDKSFVMDMIVDDNDAVIVRSTIDLAHNMGRKVVAEGVDNEEILALLGILGCDMAQGYQICKPVPGDNIPAWIRDRSREKAS